MQDAPTDLRAEIAYVLANRNDRQLRMSVERAESIKARIIDADLGDADALTAYDLCHALTTFGRAR
jgi:hypothetical protein